VRYNVPIYDPFGDRGGDYYHPSDPAALHLLHIGYAHQDIARLFGMMNNLGDPHDSRLLVKYAIVELVSLDDHLTKLVNHVRSGQAAFPISADELDEVRRLTEEYERVKAPNMGTIVRIRHKLGAHRDSLDPGCARHGSPKLLRRS
jgi:hypothetical protein